MQIRFVPTHTHTHTCKCTHTSCFVRQFTQDRGRRCVSLQPLPLLPSGGLARSPNTATVLPQSKHNRPGAPWRDARSGHGWSLVHPGCSAEETSRISFYLSTRLKGSKKPHEGCPHPPPSSPFLRWFAHRYSLAPEIEQKLQPTAEDESKHWTGDSCDVIEAWRRSSAVPVMCFLSVPPSKGSLLPTSSPLFDLKGKTKSSVASFCADALSRSRCCRAVEGKHSHRLCWALQ